MDDRNLRGIIERLGVLERQVRDVKTREGYGDDVSVPGFLRLRDAGELTISGGMVTVTGSYHRVDTEGGAASDDLDTINGGTAGDLLIVRAEDNARTVVCKDGAGNLQLAGDFSPDHINGWMLLQYDGANWCEVARSG